MRDATKESLGLFASDLFQFGKHFFFEINKRIRDVCFHCETLYLCGDIELEQMKPAYHKINGMRLCGEHKNEYQNLMVECQ